MRWGWLVLLFLFACSEQPLPTAIPVATVVREETPPTSEPSAEENKTFLPAIEIAGTGEMVEEEATEAYPVPTPEPISPRPVITVEAATSIPEPADEIVPAETTYTVQPGDILGFIARDFGITMAELMAANGIANPNQIEVGQVLVIPASAVVIVDATQEPDEATVDEEDAVEVEQTVGVPPETYIVQPGDSLGKIAERFGIPLVDLAAANGLSVTSFVYVDQVLVISSDDTPQEPAQTYVIQRGDTLRSVAERFGITVNALSAANAITNPNTIFVGQVLIIPNQ